MIPLIMSTLWISIEYLVSHQWRPWTMFGVVDEQADYYVVVGDDGVVRCAI